jgi:hypothetical protein
VEINAPVGLVIIVIHGRGVRVSTLTVDTQHAPPLAFKKLNAFGVWDLLVFTFKLAKDHTFFLIK